MSNPEAAVREYPSVLAVAQGYGLDVTNYAAVPGGYLLDAATGKYWLKPFAGSEKELSYVIAASEHLMRRGFPYLTRCLRLRDGSPGIRFRRVLFHLVEAAPGPAPELKTVEDLRAAGARLGGLHLAARAFEPPPDLAETRMEWGNCEREFKERLLDLYDFQETCIDRPRRTRFDALYLERFNDFVDAAREAVDIVTELPLARMIAVARADRQFCHGDFTPSALAIDSRGELTVTDLEMARFDLRAVDVAELIRATNDYDADRADAVLEGYHATFPLAHEDVRLVEAYLRFPRDYWRAANAYYREGINARARLSEAVANFESNRRFLDSFRRLGERFPTGSLYLESHAEPLLFAPPDGFFPPAAFSAGASLSADEVPKDDGVQALVGDVNELGELPFAPLAAAVGDDDAAEQASPVETPTAPVGRRRTIEDRCLFEEPLPARRRGVVTPVPDGAAIEAPEAAHAENDIMTTPVISPAEIDVIAAPAISRAEIDIVTAPDVSSEEPPADVPSEIVAPLASAAMSERKKTVWKFPAPLAKQEEKE